MTSQGWMVIPHHSAKSGGIGLVEEDILSSQFLRVISCDHGIRIVQLHYGLCLAICQHPAKFGGHKSSGGRNIPFSVCHLTLCNQVVRRTGHLMGAFTSP